MRSPPIQAASVGGSNSNRCVALIDMDCFYCACERALDPSLNGVPLAVIQYNPFENNRSAADGNVGGVVSIPAEPAAARVAVRGGKVLLPAAQNGSIIAVSYEARARGVTRFFRGKEAVKQCPELVLVQVPTAHGKSDMGVYRMYGAKTLKLVRETIGGGVAVEKASVDEMYLDLTAPARALLSAAPCFKHILDEARAANTHVAGAAEAAEEAAFGAQPSGPLARNSFRAGHAGQVERAIRGPSEQWWLRPPELWVEDEAVLAAGAVLVARARLAVTQQLGFTCSAGIAANKLLAKLCGGLHKPNQQTVLPRPAVQALLDPLPVDRLRGLGGKLGELLRTGRPKQDPPLPGFESAGALRMAGASAVSRVLRGEWAHHDEVAAHAVKLARGEDDTPVEDRGLAKQVGSSKNFSGKRNSARGPLDTKADIERWARELAGDIESRLAEEAADNGRAPSALIVACRFEDDGFGWSASRSKRAPLRPHATTAAGAACGGITADALAREAMQLVGHLASGRREGRLGLTLLALTTGDFVPLPGHGGPGVGAAGSASLKRMFEGASEKAKASKADGSTRLPAQDGAELGAEGGASLKQMFEGASEKAKASKADGSAPLPGGEGAGLGPGGAGPLKRMFEGASEVAKAARADGCAPLATWEDAGLGGGTGPLKRMFEGASEGAKAAKVAKGAEGAEAAALRGGGGSGSSRVWDRWEAVGASAAVDEDEEGDGGMAAAKGKAMAMAKAVASAKAEAVAAVRAEAAAVAEWECGACTLLNQASVRRCAVCGAIRGGSLPAAATLAAHHHQRSGRLQPQQQPRGSIAAFFKPP